MKNSRFDVDQCAKPFLDCRRFFSCAADEKEFVGFVFTEQSGEPFHPWVFRVFGLKPFLSQSDVRLKLCLAKRLGIFCFAGLKTGELGQALGKSADRFSCVAEEHTSCSVSVCQFAN